MLFGICLPLSGRKVRVVRASRNDRFRLSVRFFADAMRRVKNNAWQILLILTLAVSASVVQSGEPTFKQEPENLRPHFVKKPVPNYPQAAYTWHRQGSGWFRLNIDQATGKVTSVKVLKSTGVKILDDSAAVTFMQWRAKPHLIDHAILPADFMGAHGDNKAVRW